MFGSFTIPTSDSPPDGQKAEIANEPQVPDNSEQLEQVENKESESAPEQNTEDVETSDAAPDSDGENDEDTENQGKPKKGFLRRVEKLNNKIKNAELEVEYWKKVALGQEAKPSAPVVSDSKPTIDQYNSLEEYTEALTDWKLEQKLASIEQRKSIENVAKTYDQKLAEFRKTAPDFDDVMAEFIEDYGQVEVPEIVQVAMESDHGPAIAYFMAKNPTEVERIAKLPTHKRLLELGKIEAKVSMTNKQEKVIETKKVSKAPAPVEPVKGTGKVDTSDIRQVTDYQEFVRLREKQMKRK